MSRKFHRNSFLHGLLVLGLILLTTTTAMAASNGTINVAFNGIKVYIQKGDTERQLVDKPNIVYDGTTYVPLRAISEMFGFKVDYDGKTQSAVISDVAQQEKPATVPSSTKMTASNGTINVTFNGITVYVQKGNAERQLVDKPNIVYDGTTYVPLRAISEMFGFYVDYDGKTQSAVISDTPVSQETENKFQSMTENDPLSVVTVNGRNFKKYQNLAYMLKFDWFTSGLFGLKLEYGFDDPNGVQEARIWFENKMPEAVGAISNVSLTAVNMTTGKEITAKQTSADSQTPIPLNGKGTMSSIIGISDPIAEINDDIFVTSVRLEHLTLTDLGYVNTATVYDFENETYTISITVYGETNSETYPLEYHVLENKVF